MTPGNLSNSLWDNFLLRARQPQRPHVMQVAAREPPAPLLLQVTRQLIDHLGAPAALLLATQDLPPDLPVELDQLAVD